MVGNIQSFLQLQYCIFALSEFFIFMASGLHKGSGGRLSDTAPWRGPSGLQISTRLQPQHQRPRAPGKAGSAPPRQVAKYGKVPLWFGWTPLKRSSGWKVTKWSTGSSKGISAGAPRSSHTRKKTCQRENGWFICSAFSEMFGPHVWN